MIRDVLSGDFGLTNINLIYSGRGYHVRVLDEDVMDASSELRGDIIQYVTGSKLPDLSNEYGLMIYNHLLYHLVIQRTLQDGQNIQFYI